MEQARTRGVLGLFLMNIGDLWLHRYGDEHHANEQNHQTT
jgi:hypothetical protein